MQVSVETTSNLERRITVGIPAIQIDGEVTKRIQDASKKVRVNGFRAGKVPLKVVKQKFGAEIRQEVLGEVINKTYFEALKKEDIQPAGMPSIDTTKNTEGEDLEYVATIEVYPDVELKELDGLTVTKSVATIGDKDVDTMIDSLRKQQATWETVKRAAKDGDQVVIDFNGKKGGEEFAGGQAENQTLVLGSNSMIPGFESGVEKMKAGDEKVLKLTFPEDYHAEELKGADVEFTVKVHSVAEQKLPAIDEELFKKFGVEEGGETAFRAEVKKNMERELSTAEKNQVKTQVLDSLLDAHEVDVPKALLANEIETMRKQMLQQFGGQAQGMDMASLLPDTLFEEQAKKRVSLGLVLGQYIKNHELKVDDKKVVEHVAEMASTYHEPQAVIDYYSTNQDAKASVETVVLEEQAVEKLLASAKIKEEKSTYEDIVKKQQESAQ
ncbi:MAG: trigger factor [Cellvibrionaceae bacterium]